MVWSICCNLFQAPVCHGASLPTNLPALLIRWCGHALFASAGVVISGDTTPHAKPHPAPLLEAAGRLGVEPGRCVYVGDDERDIVAGHAAGMSTVSATYGYGCAFR